MEALLTEGQLKDHPFMADADAEFLNHMDEFAKEVEFQKGETIFTEGDYADRFYLILNGEVTVECKLDGRATKIARLGAGDVLGCGWLYSPYRALSTARATKPSTAIKLNGASLLIRAEEDPKFGYQLMKRTSHYLMGELAAMRKRLVQEIKLRENANDVPDI